MTVPEKKLTLEVETWSVKVDGVDLNYGQVHEMIHRDISTGNEYRKERIKLLISLATGVFALTVTFNKDLFGGKALTREGLIIVLLGWAFLLASLAVGVAHFAAWESHYLKYRKTGAALWRWRVHTDSGSKDEAAKSFKLANEEIKELIFRCRIFNWIQCISLIAGLALIGLYVAQAGFAMTGKPDGTARETLPTQPTGAEKK